MAAEPAAAAEIGPLMTGNVISGKNVAATVRAEVKAEVAALKAAYGKVCGSCCCCCCCNCSRQLAAVPRLPRTSRPGAGP